jgi:hypothetical protein
MKKITLFLSLSLIAWGTYAQTQRIALYEEFSGENSTPASTVDPALHTLLQTNTGKILPITYLTNLPSNPPFNSLYGQDRRDERMRMTYYNVTWVPYARLDGKALPDVADTTQNGLASLLTQNIIDTTYADKNAPFTVVLSHVFHPAYDSVVVTMTVTATQAFTASSTLKAQIVMEEAAIHLAAASGSNGVKDFYNVCRAMIPASTGGGAFGGTGSPGTTLPASWTLGQSQTFSYTAVVPNTIYNKGQICFVGFVQDSASRVVEQAGFSVPQPIKDDAAITQLTGLPFLTCGTSVTPIVTLLNRGSDTLTSCQISYVLDATAAVQVPWTGSLDSGKTIVVTLPAITGLAAGAHRLTVQPVSPNGMYAINTTNISQTGNFTIDGTPAAAPLVQPFTPSGGPGPGAFPPAGWSILNPDNDQTWRQSTTAGNLAAGSAEMRFPRSPAGLVDYLYAINTDLSAKPTALLTFAVAHAQAKTEADSLLVQASSDCGTTWTTVYAKGGAQLATSPKDSTQTYTPTTTGDWRTDTVNMNAFGGKNNVIIRFKAVSAAGNNLFVDDVNLSDEALGIAENTAISGMSIYPNPFAENTQLDFTLVHAQTIQLSVTNTLGQVVTPMQTLVLPAGHNQVMLNCSNLSSGMYFVNLTSENFRKTNKVNILK